MSVPPLNRITTGPNWKPLQRAYKTGKDAILLEGASRTGKSWDISVFIITYMQYNTGKQINICRDHLAKLKKTTYRTFKKVWQRYGLPLNQFNKSATPIEYNGNTITFVGLNDDIMIAYGLESDLLWVNEGVSISKDTLNQLQQRTTDFIIIDYNPIYTQHHIFDLEFVDGFTLHKTTIFDNWKYAPAKAKAKIISYAHPDEPAYQQAAKAGYSKKEWDKILNRNVEQKTADLYMWRVMGLGMRAAGEDTIFKKWNYYKETPTNYDWQHYGLDFGYSADESAFVKITKVGNRLYLELIIYETGLLNKQLAKKIHDSGYSGEMVVCDTSPAQNAYELIEKDISAYPYPWKKAGSVAWGIQMIQQFELYVHEDSVALIDELRKYKWKKDSKGDFVRNSLKQRVPVDKDDHAIQATIYGATVYLDPPADHATSQEENQQAA